MNLYKPQRLSTSRLLIFIAASASIAMTANLAAAATIFESGTLGPTGLPQGSVASANVTLNVFVGVRFQLTQPAITTQVGGHFVDRSNGTLFGAIIALDNAKDFPDSGDLSTKDVLGSTLLIFPAPSAEVFGGLTLSLDPGWYALVFGSGLFEAAGNGAAPLNNPDIEDPSYIAYVSSRWKNSSPTGGFEFKDYRFVIRGATVPEPSTLSFILVAIAFVVHKRTSNKR